MSPDRRNLEHILKLLDDESPVVKEAVVQEILKWGPDLERTLLNFPAPLAPDQKKRIQNIFAEYCREDLRKKWQRWFDLESDEACLEDGLELLAEFQNGSAYPVKLKDLLDTLAEEYKKIFPKPDAHTLADFLFKQKRIRGVETDYYNPANSNLVYVIERKQGIPISLSCIFLLVGARLGLKIEGCNFPGHFLARIREGERIILIDCFNGAKFLRPEDIENNHLPEVQEILYGETDAFMIVARVLHNLIRAYEQAEDTANGEFMMELLKTLDEHYNGPLDTLEE